MSLYPYECEARGVKFENWQKACRIKAEFGYLMPYACEDEGIPYEEYRKMAEGE